MTGSLGSGAGPGLLRGEPGGGLGETAYPSRRVIRSQDPCFRFPPCRIGAWLPCVTVRVASAQIIPFGREGDDTVGGVGYIPATHPRNKRSATSLDTSHGLVPGASRLSYEPFARGTSLIVVARAWGATMGLT